MASALLLHLTFSSFILNVCVSVYTQSCLTLFNLIYQALLSMKFSRQEYWCGLPIPPPGDLPEPKIKPVSFSSPALAGKFFTTASTGKPNG